MKYDNDRRLYVQLAPNKAGIQALERIGRSLPRQTSGRLLPLSELHVTLIHFGVISDVIRTLRQSIDSTDTQVEANIKEYISATKRLLTTDSYELTPLHYDRFGAHGTTLVARYEAPPELHEIHSRAYEALLHFFEACGITNPKTYAENDVNFRYASRLTPHVTIYKGYDGPDPAEPLPPLRVHFMKLEY